MTAEELKVRWDCPHCGKTVEIPMSHADWDIDTHTYGFEGVERTDEHLEVYVYCPECRKTPGGVVLV